MRNFGKLQHFVQFQSICCLLNLWKMSANIENDVDGEYAIEILREMSKNDDLREIKLVSEYDKQIFAVHRLVMMSSSSYFKALLGPNFEEGQKDEVPIANIDGPTLKLIIDFCYTGKIKITDANIMEIVAAASVMNLVRIEQMCEQFWNDKLRVANCVEIFGCADKYSFLDLRQKSLDFICEHFVDVAPSDLQELEFEFIAEVLKCNEINALEEYIFQQMLQWVDCDGEKRSQYCADVLKMIQMEKIPLPFLLDVAEDFAKKHNCFALVTNEYRRRNADDCQSIELYRHTTTDAKDIYQVSAKEDGVVIVEKYNKISDRWHIFRIMKVSCITERKSFGLIFDKTQILLIGGQKGKTFVRTVNTCMLDSMELLNEEKIETARGHIMPIFHEDEIYIFGGWSGSLLEKCERLCLETLTTEEIQPMHYGRYDYSATTMAGKIYVAGGKADENLCLYSVECYDPDEDIWTKVTNMIHARANFALVESKGMLYAMGYHKCIERYDPTRDVWTVIGSFENSEHITQAVNLHNDIYVAMKDGTFGKFQAEPVCSLRPLRSALQNTSNLRCTLFVD